jgi:hypothetical protein
MTAWAFAIGARPLVIRTGSTAIMHRVQRAQPAGGGSMTLLLRGDRNHAADPPMTLRSVERPLFVVPSAGRPLTWLRGRWAQYWLGVLTGVLALLWVSIRQRRALAAREPAPTTARARRAPLRA